MYHGYGKYTLHVTEINVIVALLKLPAGGHGMNTNIP